MNDREFIQQIKEGSEPAFRQLVEQYQQMVVNTCLGLIHNLDDTEDIAQEVFIEVFQSIHKFRSDSKLSTWLYRIAVNKSLNYIRDNKKRLLTGKIKDIFSRINDSHSDGCFSPDQPDTKLQEKQKAEFLHRAIDKLPKNQRVAFTLNKYEDLPYKEIAEVMAVSLSSVESLIHRAKKNLQTYLYDCYKKDC